MFYNYSTLEEFINGLWMGDAAKTNYPPYDIIKEVENGQTYYTVNMAVAGFSRDEIEVIQSQDQIVVRPTKEVYRKAMRPSENKDPEARSFVYKGIAKRMFEKSFMLDQSLEVNDVVMFNGILSIKLKVNLPEDRKPKYLTIR